MENTSSSNGQINFDDQKLRLFETVKILDVERACLDGSTFDDISATGIKIMNANLSDLEIEGAQLGGAYIHNIGMPPEGHPAYNPDLKQRPLKFENCDLHNTTLTNCNLTGVSIENCNLSGMSINGVSVEKLIGLIKLD
ncbi:hypothetical protein BH09BAC6_BH09BAC6_10080 [soil metagenome]